MKSIFVSLLLAVAVPLSVSAQESKGGERRQSVQKSPEQRAEAQTQRMEKTLSLTPQQRQAVFNANLKAAQEMQPVKEQMRAARQKAKAIRQEQDAAMKQTLTADQYQKLETMRMERKKRMQANMEHRRVNNQRQPRTELQTVPNHPAK